MAAPNTPDPDGPWRDQPHLRGLYRLVVALGVVMMAGVLAVAATLVIRVSAPPPAIAQVTAEAIALPEGAEVVAVGATAGALTVMIREGEAERILTFHPETGAPIGETAVTRR